MKRTALYFTAPYQVTVGEEPQSAPQAGQVLVRSLFSAISPGTETLLYRGQFPTSIALDESIASLAGEFRYPLKYGYALVGEVEALGQGVDPIWEGRHVFAFHPHESRFLAAPGELLPVPEGTDPLEAVFLPNAETAVNFVLDGAPRLGERVAVLGQGIVGLLTTGLLAQFPLETLLAFDRYPLRRQASLDAGAHASLDPGALDEARTHLGEGADLTFELSGSPEALDAAIALTGFAGRVIIGSWYGQKRVTLDLGGRFHRSRIRLLSSQVSSLAPELSGRWTKERRFAQAWELVRRLRPARWITHRFPITAAAQAYAWLDEHPAECIQVLLTY